MSNAVSIATTQRLVSVLKNTPTAVKSGIEQQRTTLNWNASFWLQQLRYNTATKPHAPMVQRALTDYTNDMIFAREDGAMYIVAYGQLMINQSLGPAALSGLVGSPITADEVRVLKDVKAKVDAHLASFNKTNNGPVKQLYDTLRNQS